MSLSCDLVQEELEIVLVYPIIALIELRKENNYFANKKVKRI